MTHLVWQNIVSCLLYIIIIEHPAALKNQKAKEIYAALHGSSRRTPLSNFMKHVFEFSRLLNLCHCVRQDGFWLWALTWRSRHVNTIEENCPNIRNDNIRSTINLYVPGGPIRQWDRRRVWPDLICLCRQWECLGGLLLAIFPSQDSASPEAADHFCDLGRSRTLLWEDDIPRTLDLNCDQSTYILVLNWHISPRCRFNIRNTLILHCVSKSKQILCFDSWHSVRLYQRER